MTESKYSTMIARPHPSPYATADGRSDVRPSRPYKYKPYRICLNCLRTLSRDRFRSDHAPMCLDCAEAARRECQPAFTLREAAALADKAAEAGVT